MLQKIYLYHLYPEKQNGCICILGSKAINSRMTTTLINYCSLGVSVHDNWKCQRQVGGCRRAWKNFLPFRVFLRLYLRLMNCA
jgi:hypothetical protein